MSKDKRLGKGLAALLGSTLDGYDLDDGGPARAVPVDVPGSTRPPLRVHREDESPEAESGHHEEILHLSVYEIDDNPFQPRRDFRDDEINSLAESIKTHQMLQPILVRRVGSRYQLISGERRLRAAIRAGLKTVPARLREADDRLVAELAIVENLQRKDLNPIEKALSFKRYLEQHQCTQEDLAQRLKIDRSTIANFIRLLDLPEEVIECLQQEKISMGHARALLSLGDEPLQIEFCRRIIAEGWNVRQTEQRVADRVAQEDRPQSQSAAMARRRPKSEHIAALEQKLRGLLGTKVEIRAGARGKGRITIHFAGHDEFCRLMEQLTGEQFG
ncbi:MAG: chromosome partitioning protein ParB [Pirellulaceae bacterium]|nr:MAG: chromosome partitioning protein ParB [Pirellulaceae bacterium]